MFKKLVLMLSLVACTGLNAVVTEVKSDQSVEFSQGKVGFGTKIKNALWTNRTKTQLGLVAALLAYAGVRICVANKKLGFATAADTIGGWLTPKVECMKCLNPEKMKGTFIETAAKGLVGYNSTIPFFPTKFDGTFPYVHKA